ncbi:hypothetical protein FXN61_06240 [Lentzea sp. PSKA42]|uniref:Penicillin-binding protein transpeptidase domain-containing protein n=1 Tax=Lentzea indica TaxID=2604800 RepID=A0ABX1FBX9_9PSEU|nr:hypothetical protein [Lentzea indica]
MRPPAESWPTCRAPRGEDKTDYAGGVLKEPGQAFFPVDVVAGLQNGQTLDTTLDGRAPRKIAGAVITDKAKCGERCTVRDALAKSSNVVMYDLVVNKIGMPRTAAAARQAGVPEAVVIGGEEKKLLVGEDGGTPNGGLSLGLDTAQMRPLDLTTVYATFAAGGVHHKTHFVTKVTDEAGNPLYQSTKSTASAFHPDSAKSKAIADQVTTVLKDNTLCPNAVCRAAEHDLPASTAIGETSHAWTVGYTDRMAITVMVGSADASKPANDSTGAPVRGTGLPKTVWQRFVERI